MMLQAHNVERSAVGVTPLQWNAGLATEAEQWARTMAATGRMRHSPAGHGKSGENIWIGTAGAFAPDEMLADWAAERANFTQGTFPHVSRSGKAHDVGHYTQMIWRDTTQVGCGLARGQRFDVMVCRYLSKGNIVGQRPV